MPFLPKLNWPNCVLSLFTSERGAPARALWRESDVTLRSITLRRCLTSSSRICTLLARTEWLSRMGCAATVDTSGEF